MSFIRERRKEWEKSQHKSRSFTARVFDHNGRLREEITRATVASAIDASKQWCTRGYDVVVRGEFTSEGTRWRGNRGRVVASCESKRWSRS